MDLDSKNQEQDFIEARRALLNILEDTEDARKIAVEEKNKTMSIVKNFADGILVFDSKNNLDLINPLVELFLNVREEEILNKNFFDFPDSEYVKILIQVLSEESGGKEISNVFRKEMQLNESLYLEVTSLPLLVESEKRGTLVILHNITREKNVEKMKTEFVSIAAHNLRTPLSAIKWTLQMILDGDVGKINDEQKEILGKTYSSNERMIRLINDLLNVTRIEEGRFLYKPEPCQLEEIVEEIIESSQGMINSKKLKLKYIKPKKLLPKVKMDREKIALAVENLIDNACKYTPFEGKLEIELSKVKKGGVQFKVKDTGVGIPKDQQDRMFTKFFRGVNVIKMETDGSGLGLYTTKNIIDSHKGKIWFESEEEKGTTFYFTLPEK